MKTNRSDIPWLFSIAVFVVVIIILGLGHHAYKNTEKNTFDQFNRKQQVMARGMSEGIKGCYKHLTGELKSLGKMLKMRHLDETLSNRLLRNLLEELDSVGVNNIKLLNRSGILEFDMAEPQLVGTGSSHN